MEYLVTGAAFLLGCILGWILARGYLISGTKASERIITQLQDQGRLLRQECDVLRQQAEQERVARTRAETRLEDTQQSLVRQRELIDESAQKLSDTFKAISSDALSQNNISFLQLAQKTLQTTAAEMTGDLERRRQSIDSLMGPLQDSLKRYETQIQEMERSRHEAYGDISRHMEELIRTQERLHDQTRLLNAALREPQVRGRWGEITLRRAVEVSGMSSHCDFVEQPSAKTESGLKRPDLIVKLPEGRQVVIDAKVPLRSYMDAFESVDDEARKACFKRHAQAVRTHMFALASRGYWKQFTPTPDFVILFLPGEAFFSTALEYDQSLIEDGIERRVILSTPTTLIALLRTIAAVWQQHSISENAQEIWETGMELFDRVSIFARHLSTIGDGIRKTTQAYNAALGSWETRVQPSAHRLKNLASPLQGKDLPLPVRVELDPREDLGTDEPGSDSS